MDSIIKNYIKFINSLPCDNCNKVVFAVYPTTIKDKNIFDVLIHYGILSEQIVESISDDEKRKVSDFKFRYDMYIKFNKLLEKYCKLYKITFINMDDVLLNKNKKLKSIYISPISNFNIHLLWEPLIPNIILKMINCDCKINKKYKIDLKKTYNYYIKQKKIIIEKKKNQIRNGNKRKISKKKNTKKGIPKKIIKKQISKKKSRYL